MQGFGHVEDATPELAMAVLAPYRGQGIGTALLSAMQERLKKNGFPDLSLSVQKKIPSFIFTGNQTSPFNAKQRKNLSWSTVSDNLIPFFPS